LSTKEIIEDPSLAANEIVVEVDHPERGTFTTIGNPLKLSDSPTHITPSPLLGQHTEEILISELGIGDEELRLLRSSGVI
ncbi:CoA transferase, partial [Streptomyces sp. NPDC047461]|uniref:CoA transferase n=1 Tax=Streptomyces sp. NPDC047461 TaxID=3155619 RepID=UPI0033E9E305